MKMTTCPKCQSPNVFVCDGGVGWDVYLLVTATGSMDIIEWETYLCTDCGYFENYVTDNDYLQKIKDGRWEKWRKAE